MGFEDTACDLLERALIDENADPTDLPLSLLKSITNNFSDNLQIGHGGFAVVYKGLLKNGVVAVKKLTQTFDIHEKKFHQEVDSLMRVNHKNIVRFLGYCSDTQGKVWKLNGKNVMAEERQRFLCFEYLPQGSLDKYISDASKGLGWVTRYQIIKGICKGLHYLHQQKIVHSDLKPANILLNHYMLPKIADFGLSRCFDEEQTRAVTSNLFGSQGYMAPEFYGGLITLKSDIYSLGIIIIEILTGNKGYPDIDDVLESWSIKSLGSTHLEPVRVCAEIGIECIESNPAKRPDTRLILERLYEMETIYGVIKANLSTSSPETNAGRSCSVSDPMVGEVQLSFVSEAPSPLQRITTKSPMGLGMINTQILDVHPLELRFPWERGQDIISLVTLTNRTDHHVGVWITPICPDTWAANFCHPVSESIYLLEYVRPVWESDPNSSLFKMMEPHSTVAVPITMSHSPKPPSRDTATFEVVMVVMGSGKDFLKRLKQSIGSRLNLDGYLLKRSEALRGEVYRAMLKATICDPASCEAVVTHTFVPALPMEVGNYVHNIDVHPTEPWVLVNVMGISKSKVFMLNYLTQEVSTAMHFSSQEIYMAKFIAQEQWFATGDSDGYVTVYGNNTKDNVIKRFSAHGGNPICVLAAHTTYPFLLTGSFNDNWIRLWDWVQGWKCTRIFDQLDDPSSIIWNALDTVTFACTSETGLKVWEVDLSKETWKSRPSDPTTTLDVKSKDCCFGGDSHRKSIITQPDWESEENCAVIWDIRGKESAHKLFVSSHVDICGTATHPTLPILATSHGWSSTVCLWNTKTYRLEKIFQLRAPPQERCMVFTGTKDLPRLLVGVKNGIEILHLNFPAFLKTDLGV